MIFYSIFIMVSWVSILVYISSRLTSGVSYSLREKIIKERGGRVGGLGGGLVLCLLYMINFLKLYIMHFWHD